MRLADFIRETTSALEALYPSGEAGNMVHLLCEERLGVKSYTHLIDPGYEIDGKALEPDVKRLLSAEPIQYVLGRAWFRGRRFNVGPGVLVPRPETEQLVSEALSAIPPNGCDGLRALDLCTGSGCIAWSLSLECPGLDVVGVDISDVALATASSQPFGSAPVFRKYDILSEVPPLGRFDVLTANPPYVMEREKALMHRNVLDYEPQEAIFVPDDDPLVFYRAVKRWADALLRDGGFGIVEINGSLAAQTLEIFSSETYRDVRLIRDIYGKNRFVAFRKS